MEVATALSKRYRLQVTLHDGRVVNVRIHACNDCNFIEWHTASGNKVVETELSDDFINKLNSAVLSYKNRCLAQLVPEGIKALGKYSEKNTKLFTK